MKGEGPVSGYINVPQDAVKGGLLGRAHHVPLVGICRLSVWIRRGPLHARMAHGPHGWRGDASSRPHLEHQWLEVCPPCIDGCCVCSGPRPDDDQLGLEPLCQCQGKIRQLDLNLSCDTDHNRQTHLGTFGCSTAADSPAAQKGRSAYTTAPRLMESPRTLHFGQVLYQGICR